MKKKILFILIAFLAFKSKGQAQDFFNTPWYATEMVINGENIAIPVLHVNPPSECSIGIRFIFHGIHDGADAYVGVCQACVGFIKNITENTFETDGYACLTKDDIGPCFTGSSQPLCSAGIFDEFEQKQRFFFESYDELVTYTITDYGNDLFGLLLEKSNGDFIEYNTEEILSIQENEILSFSLTPNPALKTLTLSGLNSDLESVVIYSLNGNKFPMVLETDSYDVSNLATGLYFISVTSADGKKAVQKFIKK